MAKSSVDVFTKSIAKELQSKGIRVNSINMGQVVDSELTRKAGPQVVSKQDKSSGGRAPDGHNMGQSVLYLASNEARFITGSVLSADGDWLSANINLMAITH
ncbi:unnamed protein product [Medioppia subpectinata]|uniref:Peroxisomal 2,4-dienoyl-CoA reductase [(3E)-enoyl-CoA-producing] n=1 Tax=Medioppia subpectinata TaxID=1979941 RepID=A0A7R9KK99_9ACAR|nr:unnamed protein product [Medioppia subpectinata]CAG2104977.1 unnamed protein product [Medioppia subpectinata]